eukprot:scaffold7634_cov417-Prasinococcus_capsulatus_cf.AAC.6
MSRPRCADTRLCIIASGIAMSANDTVDQSMIADGSCRMTTPDPTGLDGNALWHYYEGASACPRKPVGSTMCPC